MGEREKKLESLGSNRSSFLIQSVTNGIKSLSLRLIQSYKDIHPAVVIQKIWSGVGIFLNTEKIKST